MRQSDRDTALFEFWRSVPAKLWKSPRKFLSISQVILAVSLVAGFASAADTEEWSRFRGPDGAGISTETAIPVKWTLKDYAWQVEVPGVGHSSPVIWGTRTFVASASEDGTSRLLLGLDAVTGKTLWTVRQAISGYGKHAKSSFASSSPATDGERVYVLFASADRLVLYAYTVDGKEAWKADLGPQSSKHGHGVSPIVEGDLVIVANDHDGASAVVAVDRETGKERWKTPRASREASYSTPLTIEVGDPPVRQLVCLSGATGLTAYEPVSGKLLWQSVPMPDRTVASPVFAQGLLFAVCGKGGRGTLLVGVRPENSTPEGRDLIDFRRDKQISYVPTCVAVGKYVFFWGDNGVVTCVDPARSDPVWVHRVGGNFSGSPVCIGDAIYCIDESGSVVVVRAGPKYDLLGKSPLGDGSYATPAVGHGRLLLRSFHKLACVESR